MARRWAWLLITGLILGALVGLVVSILQSPVYESSTRILVMRAPQEKTNDYTYLSDQQLVQTYIQLLTTKPVLQRTSETLGSSIKASQVKVDQINDTQAIQVTVEDENPQRSSDIANILVQVLISQNEIIQSARYASTEQSIQAQITQIENQIRSMGTEIENISAETVVEQQKQVEFQIASLQAEVTQLQNDIQIIKSSSVPGQQTQLAEKEARLNQILPVLTLYQQTYTDLVVLGKPVTLNDGATRLTQLQSTMQLYQEIYTNLLNNLESIRLARLQNTPNVVQIESASPPSNPVRPKPFTNTGLAAVIGLLLAGGIAFLIEYIDDTIRSPEDIERVLNLPVIGYIGDMDTQPGESADVHVLYHPRSPVSEAFRSLRTNLEFTNVDQTLSKILITSSGPGEGKTTIAINLATIIAQSGKRVLLIDADMRRPRVHNIFGISNKMGLSTLFRSDAPPVQSIIRPVEGMQNIFILPSGSPPPNPTELLASAKMDNILQEASQLVDMIIVDSPPALVADYQVLATKLDGVLLVIQPGHTHADAAFAMREQLERVNGRVLGVVLNKIPHDSFHYGGYHHYYYYPNKKDHYYSALPETQGSQPLLPESNVIARAPEPHMEFYIPTLPPEPEYEYEEVMENYAETPPRGRIEVYTPIKDTPATTNVITQPKKRKAEFHPSETSSYVIQKHQLEYWYEDKEQ